MQKTSIIYHYYIPFFPLVKYSYFLTSFFYYFNQVIGNYGSIFIGREPLIIVDVTREQKKIFKSQFVNKHWSMKNRCYIGTEKFFAMLNKLKWTISWGVE